MNSQGSRVEKQEYQECKSEEFRLQTRLGIEICSSDVILHKGHWISNGLPSDMSLVQAPNGPTLKVFKNYWGESASSAKTFVNG